MFNVSNIQRGIVLIDETISNSLWNLEGQTVQYPTTLPGVSFVMKLKRKPQYFTLTLALPLIAVMLMTISGFILAKSGEKMTVTINSMLSYFLIYLVLVDHLPAVSDNIPMLMTFYSIQISKSIGISNLLSPMA